MRGAGAAEAALTFVQETGRGYSNMCLGTVPMLSAGDPTWPVPCSARPHCGRESPSESTSNMNVDTILSPKFADLGSFNPYNVSKYLLGTSAGAQVVERFPRSDDSVSICASVHHPT